MELSVLKLGCSRRRFGSGQFAFDYETGYLNISNPSPVSPFARSTDEEDYEMVFEQHQSAIPFIWEEKPGTPRGVKDVKWEEGSEDDSLTGCSDPSSRNSSTREAGDSSPNSDFQFISLQTARKKAINNQQQSKPADELFAKGRILPLKPPPRLQSIMAADSGEDARGSSSFSSSCRNLGHSFRKDGMKTPTRSFRKDGLKALIASPRGGKQGELVTTMLGFEERPKDENWKDGSGHHRKTSSLSKLPTLFRKKYDENESLDGDASSRKMGLGAEKRRPFDSLSSSMLDGSYGDDDFCISSRSTFDLNARTDHNNTSGRTILEERPEDRDEEMMVETPQKKPGRLSRFFTKKPSRISAVAPSPSPEDLTVKRVQNTSLLKMCFSNAIGQALIRGVKHFRSLDSQPRHAHPASR